MSKINSSRLRHVVAFYGPGEVNEYGEYSDNSFIFECRSEVQVKRGNQMADYGTVLTSEVITALMYYDDRASNAMTLHWDSKEYEIQHIAPDTVNQSMIVTAERVSK